MSISPQADRGLKEITRREETFDYRVLFFAVIISLSIHLFWLTAVQVVAPKVSTGTVKFSKVSFLGPILSKGIMEVKVGAREESYLEKRYNEKKKSAAIAEASGSLSSYLKYTDMDPGIASNYGLLTSSIVAESMSERKFEASETSDP